MGFAVYGFHVSSFKPIHDYLFHRRSILSPLLFNIHLCGLFYFLEDLDIASHSDYTTIYTVNKKESVITVFESSSTQLFGSFNNNFMKASNGKKKCLKERILVVCRLIAKEKEILLVITINHLWMLTKWEVSSRLSLSRSVGIVL